MKFKCKAIKCPDNIGKLLDICKRCSTYTDRYIDCPQTYCEVFPEECNSESIFCKRCVGYANCYGLD